MISIDASNYINFYINVESFKISVEQGLFEIYLTSVGDQSTDDQAIQLQNLIKEAAYNIYDTYFKDDAPSKLNLIDHCYSQKIQQLLESNDLSQLMKDSLFDEVYCQVRDIILNYELFYPAFKKSKQYKKLLDELDLFNLDEESSLKFFDDLSETDSVQTNCPFVDASVVLDTKNLDDVVQDTCLDDSIEKYSTDIEEKKSSNRFIIDIVETGLLNEFGKSFVAYLINIEKSSGEQWVILRRYSEFYSFHQTLLNKCEKYRFNLKSILFLPPKSILSNHTSEKFIRYRKYMLNIYLKKLNYLYEKFSFLREDIDRFLQPGNYQSKDWSKTNNHLKVECGATRSTISNPIKSIGNAVKNKSENILDGFHKLSRTLSLQPEVKETLEKKICQTNSLNSRLTPTGEKLFAETETINGNCDDSILYENNLLQNQNSESDYEDNIPLLLLLDEIFDLKSSNFWLRRTIIDLFKQIIEATYSETINKKIIDYIDDWTSPTSLCELIKMLK